MKMTVREFIQTYKVLRSLGLDDDCVEVDSSGLYEVDEENSKVVSCYDYAYNADDEIEVDGFLTITFDQFMCFINGVVPARRGRGR